ncbi:hypothetical protein QM480_10350 [Flectobacillus sp. DC10W]|jgi:hypothetical protein|uniref:Outer membrane protein beta-barrel domain-containing protein n=1 Tax=Flectobacillus longus TaxID=2984207 RepID=A0ABT6YMC1_9BACT|nr:hypothetical protein [Flectobacillus longus]MDI9864725.1 hypothetical protein [Flectobacillus longus]
MKKHYFLIALILYSHYHLFAQSVSLDTLVLASGETKIGTLKEKGWMKNPSKIKFITTEGKSLEYFPTQLKGFKVGESVEQYETHTVSMDLSMLGNSYTSNTESIIVKDTTVFLSVLVEGQARLLYYMDNRRKEHFYLQLKGEAKPEELIERKEYILRNGQRVLATSKDYIVQLSVLGNCNELNDFSGVSLTKSSLIKTLVKYNQCVGYTTVKVVREDNDVFEVWTQLGVGIGFQRQYDYKKTPLDFNNIHPVIGIGLDMVIPRTKNKFRVTVDANYHSFDGNNISYPSEAKYINLTLGPKYDLLNNKKTRLYVTAGYGIYVKLSNAQKDNSWVRPIDLSGEYGGLGFVHKRVAVELKYENVNNAFNWLYSTQSAYNFSLLVKYRLL